MENTEFLGRQPRRKFLTGFFASAAGAITALLFAQRGQAVEKKPQAPEAGGPILYRRTEETERYYRTLYR
jgi:hypothetical protein